MSTDMDVGPRPGSVLAGVKVLELAHVIAGPLAGTLMADLGADVVHVEDPKGGDSLRQSGPKRDGVPLWWKVSARNKRSVTLDLRTPPGQELARRLVAWSDVVITNFRPDRLQSWGLDWERLHFDSPKLIMLHVTGFGLNTARRNDPGFGKMGEARSGVVAITGDAEGRPMFAGFSHADSVTGLMGAMAIQAALYRRAIDDSFEGELIDLALADSLYRLIEWQLVIHDQLGIVPHRAGNRPPIAPGEIVDTYATKDGQWLLVTSATLRSVLNIGVLVGEDPADFASSELQKANGSRLDAKLREWIAEHSMDECLVAAREHEVVVSEIFTVENILSDETYRERGLILSVDDSELGPITMQGVVPRFVQHPGSVWRAGPELGQDNEKVYMSYIGLTRSEYDSLRQDGTI